MKHTNYYAVLGVKRGASPDEIKIAYRTMARRFHPDQNQDNPSAEERFKHISEAYRVLQDAASRKTYDRFGTAPSGSAFGPTQGLRLKQEDAFSNFVSGFAKAARRRARKRRGRDIRLDAKLSFSEGALGCRRTFDLPRSGDPDGQDASIRSLEFKLPGGVFDGQVLRWRGEGGPGQFGGEQGDLSVTVRVADHALLRRRGSDTICDLPLSLLECVDGARLQVPTVHGPMEIVVPSGTKNLAELRVASKGAQRPDGTFGDAIFVCKLEIPTSLDTEQRALLTLFYGALDAVQLPDRSALDEECAR